MQHTHMPAYSSSCHCICQKKKCKLEYEVHTNMKNMQKYAPPLADVALPLQVGVGLTRMAATPRWRRLFCSGTLCGRVEAGFLPALDEDQADMFTPSELRLYQHAQDHRLLTLDILGYPSLYGYILG